VFCLFLLIHFTQSTQSISTHLCGSFVLISAPFALTGIRHFPKPAKCCLFEHTIQPTTLKKIIPLCLVAILAASFSSDTSITADELKINQVQIIATHNSYHLRTDKAVLRFMKNLYALHLLPKGDNPAELDYTKDPLSVQLGQYNVRGLELDIWSDPNGGRFYHRKGKAYVWKCTASRVEALKKPGFKIMHIPDFDFNTTNYTFVDALAEIKKWSEANPYHLPLFINVESETETPGDNKQAPKGLTHAAPFDSAALDAMDNEVKSVFGQNLDGIITPDRVRGNYATLEEAVLAGNWPTIGAARGKIIFIIDQHENVGELYKTGHPSYKGRPMFVYLHKGGTPEAAFIIHNGSVRDQEKIKEDVRKGYIVRTRTDEGTNQARTGDYSDRDAAFSSGAQIISTDYYKPDYRAGTKGWTDFHIVFPQGSMARVDTIAQHKIALPLPVKE